MTLKQTVEVEGQQIELSNLDKVLWPRAGITKALLLEYHAQLHKFIVQHWQERTITVTRYPHGVDRDFFYQKNAPTWVPDWVKTHEAESANYVVVNDLKTLVWLVNSAAIEFHPSTFQINKPSTPSYAIIDLDPTPPLGFEAAVEAAKYCHELLDKLNLKGYPKVSGGTGIHIYIPLKNCYDFKVSNQLIHQIGLVMQRAYPQKFTLERLIKKRSGVYLDYLQNHPAKTMIGVYSPRSTAEATVSTPVGWSDLEYYQPRDFTIKTVPHWVKERGDLFQPVLLEPQTIDHLLGSFILQ